MFHKDDIYPIHKVTLSNGCNVSYIDEGKSDTTLLFIHGLATYAYSWVLNIRELKSHYRCIALDLPGNGYSEGGDFDYGINFYSGCVYDFMQQLQLKNVVLVGHSMGGQIAATLVINQPDACEQLILCAPAGIETFSVIERTIYHAGINFLDFFSSEEYSLRETINTSFYNKHPKADEMIQELIRIMKEQPMSKYRRMIEMCITGMLNEPVYDKLKTINQPTLILFGERDALIPNKLMHPLLSTKSVAETGLRQIPNAHMELLPKCGHFLQIEKAEEVNLLIREFLS